jgi:hypothetical protein
MLRKVLGTTCSQGDDPGWACQYETDQEGPGAVIAIVRGTMVHSILQESPRQRAANTRNQTPALLRG